LSEKVYDVSEFLASVEPIATRHPLPLTVAYHDACHLSNGQSVRQQPRALLTGIPSLNLVELNDGGRCCGSAGTYNLFQPEMAATLGDLKADVISATGASMVVAGNPGCLLQIEAALRRSEKAVTARHTIELVDASLRPPGRPLPRPDRD
jgi:glycolate oxidase iron-sulfur subunit